MDENTLPLPQSPPDGQMVIAVLPDGLVKPIPQRWISPRVAPMQGIVDAVIASFGADARVVTVPQQDFPQHHTVHYHAGQFTFTPVVQPPKPLSLDQLAEVVGYLLPGFEADEPPTEPPAPEPTPEPIDASIIGPLEALKAKIDAVRAGSQELTPDELISMHRDDPPGAAAKLEDAIRALKGDARRKLSELLNVELAELKNLRGMAGEDREREQGIEYLLGLFTRLGEI
jgi:hypothetical protein